ncbi:Gfo/Idh/MocA family protein [Legionella gresilensis]|uniref:Gfo/Idh/MocA family protein n=1 Tax=Legionella gresilensis TaxID=91823 RepID=UPI0010417BFD|nr:Gfo/Idh/MocA family oxidoreductase [Legionella gresilensis]
MKIAIIGCGKQALKHLNGFIQNQIDEFVLYDPIIERSQELAAKFNCQYTDNLNDIFTDNTVKAVDICTPVEFHKDLAIKAIFSKKHFFCEKPLTISLADDEMIRDLAIQHRVVGMVGYIYRFSPILQEVREIVKNNIIGEVHSALFRIGSKGNHAHWKHLRSTNGGALNEMAVHMIDLALWYFDDINEIQLLDAEICLPVRMIENQALLSDTEDFVLAKLRTKQGQHILLMADFLSSDFNQSVELQGSNGSLKASIQPNYPHELNLIKSAGSYNQGKTKLICRDDDLYEAQMHHFINLIINEGFMSNNFSLVESCKVSKIHNYLRDEILKVIPKQNYPQEKVSNNGFINASEPAGMF